MTNANFSANLFLDKFSEIFSETDRSLVKLDTEFRKLDEWSSLAALMLIAMVNEHFDLTLTNEDIRSSKTVYDLIEKTNLKQR